MKDKLFDNLVVGIGIVLIVVVTVIIIVKYIDKGIERQDTMLCESAKVSGNEYWLKKCQCYYEGKGIRCLQNEGN